ncbi:MAG: hypothetical protein VYB30_00655 [Candidatus Thermoplasmatota archaeon]|nr:hypothetical protein [Candidatus Thermoplasmatota archaeon]
MFAQTLHHLVVGLTTGVTTLACLCAIAAWVSNYFVGAKNARAHLDTAAYIAAIAALPLLPIAVLSGTMAMSDPANDAMSYNKFLFTGLTTGFLASMVIGRWRFGPGVWNEPKLALLQAISAIGALASITVLGSIGAKMTLGESTMDILPFWPAFDDSVVVNEWISLVLLILGLAAMVAAFMLGPKAERISLD